MGLLDSLFSSDSYGGQGGGLLDFLRNAQFQQGQYQPSAGFPDQPQPRQLDNAMFDASTYAPNQAQPIAVGNYQMPRIGGADQFMPQQAAQAAIPPNAQPTQGQLPTAPQQAPSTDISAQSRQAPQEQPLPPAFGGTSVLGRIGNPDGLIARLTGNDSRSIAQQNLKAQFDSLVQAGMPRNVAMAATLNPKILEQVGPSYFAKDEIVDGGTDPLTGKKTFVLKNTVDGKVTELNSSGTGAAPSGLQETISNLNNMPSGATPEQRLAQVPEAYRGYIKSLLAGQALPSNVGRSTLRGPIMTLAHAVDPTFDEANIPLRFKTTTDYAPNGQSGRSIVALNTVQHHIGKLSDDLENVGDTGWSILNSIRNGIAVNTPMDPKQGKAVQAIQDDIKAVSDEMSSAYKAGRVSDHEIEAWNRLANSNLPLRQLKQGIYDFVGLLNGKRDQLNETHQSIVGREAPGINKELNSTITQKVTQRNSDSPAAGNKPATVTQNGHTYTLQADGSYK